MYDDKKVISEEPNYQVPITGQEKRGIANYLIKKGWVKDERQAFYVMIVIISIGFVVMITTWIENNHDNNTMQNIHFNPEYQVEH